MLAKTARSSAGAGPKKFVQTQVITVDDVDSFAKVRRVKNSPASHYSRKYVQEWREKDHQGKRSVQGLGC